MGRWLTIKQKRDIIAKATQCPRLKHSDLAEWATTEFKLPTPLARSTVSDIIRKASAIMSSEYGDGTWRRTLKVTSIRRLAVWIAQQESRNVCLSRGLIEMKARELQGQLCDA
ncbi:hypothetical protein PF010_g11024 [Phytophthora fragariae]|uniref:HTH CENPB-type domain-containing protein n=2 Tax=Phytophthora TaxID=4783 RepID=A0A6A3U818_9STRA|nr:hypothetical protein PF003_g30220 [Phytophthora fragariae]KAE9030737.1 hypothetical protein PR002_g9812 [Phytophthora rubi]KAE9014293.1 hypothetical protein PF011_g8125 [Phytophthora fragariae]KAE9034275.1 hypothetical protein PR001_g9804 [Phytophthora rubi]KAE9098050.1 hypothetical protein PF007_g16406 [Phytophthora fragariae]